MTTGQLATERATMPGRLNTTAVFNFHHLKVDYKDREKWSKRPFDFMKLKELLTDWQEKMDQGGGWNALFWNNHDQPWALTRFGDTGKYRVVRFSSLGRRSRSSSSQLQVNLPLHGQVVGGHDLIGSLLSICDCKNSAWLVLMK